MEIKHGSYALKGEREKSRNRGWEIERHTYEIGQFNIHWKSV